MIRLITIAALAGGLLVGCGFEPIFKSNGPNSTSAADIRHQIVVPESDSAAGFQFRNALLRFIGSPHGKAPWQLKYTVSTSTRDFLVVDVTNVTRRNRLVSVIYSLSKDGEEVITNRKLTTESGYNIVGSTFTIRESEDHSLRTASEALAHKVWLDIAASYHEYVANGRNQKKSPAKTHSK